jgi:hypothetical protein
MFDIQNGGALDNGTQGACNSGYFSATNGNLNTSLTTGGGSLSNNAFLPSVRNGIIFSAISNSYDTVSATATSGAVLQNGFLSGATQTGNTPYYENDGIVSYANSNTSPLAIIYTYAPSPPNRTTNVGIWSSITVNVRPLVPHRGGVIQ